MEARSINHSVSNNMEVLSVEIIVSFILTLVINASTWRCRPIWLVFSK